MASSSYSDENQRLFKRFAPLRMRLEGGDGPAVVFIGCDHHEAMDTADDQVDLLLDEGWSPSHVALLTTGRRHPVQVERQDELGQRGYWHTFCVNEDGSTDRFRERLYVGDPGAMARAGEEVARALGAAGTIPATTQGRS